MGSKELPTNAGNARNQSLIPGSGIFPGVESGKPFQYLLPGKFYGHRILVSYRSLGPKELDVTSDSAHTHSQGIQRVQKLPQRLLLVVK